MASKDYALIDVQDDGNDEINLQHFMDFPGNEPINDDKTEEAGYFNNIQDTALGDSEEKLNLIGDEDQLQKSSYSLWNFEYYQQYFNVNTKQVGERILWSMVPKSGVHYLESHIRPNPDLYGPIWISITLVFTTAIIGNLVNYMDFNGDHWKYHFRKVTLAASLIFSYTFLVPIVVWGIIQWKGYHGKFSLLELICIYGYSLSIFIPVSIIWTVPLRWMHWCLGIVSSVVSGSVLFRTILSVLPHEAQKFGVALIVFIVHMTLSLSFMLYFLNSPYNPQVMPPKNVLGNLTTDNLTPLDDIHHPNISSRLSKIDERNNVVQNISSAITTVGESNTGSVKPKLPTLSVRNYSENSEILKSNERISDGKRMYAASVVLKNNTNFKNM